jgi:uncharacterized protein DUF5615
VDAVSARDLGVLSDEDNNHLERAGRMDRVFVTTDQDFLQLAAMGIQHGGIIFGIQEDHTLGDWVKGLELICFVYNPTELKNHVEYL